MGDEKKSKKQTGGDEVVTRQDLEDAVAGVDSDAEWRACVALESIAESLKRLATKFAPPGTVATVHARGVAKCDRGHGMQPTDEYCQTCYAETHPKPEKPGPSAA